ncbi:MAG: rubrerythrin family protein [Phycisphaerae bacterium]|jgi:rubrerythrin
MKLKGSQTEKNLMAAFAGESQARMRYTYFAKKAGKDGYEQISAIFAETAEQEKQHAKREFEFLEGGEVEITAAFPAGVIGSTYDNLLAAAAGEDYETTTMYPTFANTAQEEGFKEIANFLKRVSIAENRHKERYLALAENIKNDTVFKKAEPKRWICRKCGYVHEGPEAPGKCPLCLHPQSFFELESVNY